MWALIIALLRAANHERKVVKLGLSVIFFDLAIFIAIEAIIVAIAQTLLNPIVMCLGIAWIIATALVIFWQGGVIVDSLILAKALGLKVGDQFEKAALIFGIIHVWIITFFMIIPVWQFWVGFPALIIALMGWMFSAPLTDVKFDWNYVRRAYKAMVPAIIGLIVIVALFKSFGSQVSTDSIRSSLGGYGIWLMIGIVLVIIGSMPKVPARKLLQVAGVATILIVVFLTLAWPTAKKELMAMEKESRPRRQIEMRVAGEKIIPVTLSSTKWSCPIYLPPCRNFDIVGPPGALFRLDADGFIGRVGEGHFPDDTRFQKGIRYKGLPGQDGRKVYIRTVPTRTNHDEIDH